MRKKEICTIISQEEISTGIYSLWVQNGDIAREASPGQFVMVFSDDGAKLLGRPISLCRICPEENRIRLVYRVTGPGTGTEEFSRKKAGDKITLLGPLGNGFPMEEAEKGHLLLIGGGIGIPPLLEIAVRRSGECSAFLGYRDSGLFLCDEFKNVGPAFAATEDGSFGIRGNVLDALRETGVWGDMIFACGPLPMLRAVSEYAAAKDIPCWISMEERMACGIGACLGCVVPTPDTDGHSHVCNKRVCKDGPVFRSTEVTL